LGRSPGGQQQTGDSGGDRTPTQPEKVMPLQAPGFGIAAT
jgi:hypothetical protein